MSRRWLEIGTRIRLLLERRSTGRSPTPELRGSIDPSGVPGSAVFVGQYRVGRFDNDRYDVMAVLRDDAVTVAPDGPSGPDVVISMPGLQVADRLDLLGMDEVTAQAAFDAFVAQRVADLVDCSPATDEASIRPDQEVVALPVWIEERTRDALLDLDCQTWIARTRTSAANAGPRRFLIGPEPEDFWWLLSLVTGGSGLDDPIVRLRLVLLVFPDEPVIVRVGNRYAGWFASSPATAPSDALKTMQRLGATYSPTVVLTEGRTDAEFLRDGLSILYPYLDDLVRFMDFDAKPEGSASALVRTLRSFVAAGISNRIVAVFDNDSAAEEAMRNLTPAALPSNVVIMQYPPLDLADCYPTYGPPNNDSPDGVLSTANVNGLAGSIELYLGRDVLTDDAGQLRPVQWRSFLAGVQRYQGEVTGKADIQRLFRAKVKSAREHGGPLPHQDWSGVQAILHQIINAHHRAAPTPPQQR